MMNQPFLVLVEPLNIGKVITLVLSEGQQGTQNQYKS